MLALRSLRDHYLRDVVAIKYHTEKVIEVATPLVTDEDGDPEAPEAHNLLQHQSELKGIIIINIIIIIIIIIVIIFVIIIIIFIIIITKRYTIRYIEGSHR